MGEVDAQRDLLEGSLRRGRPLDEGDGVTGEIVVQEPGILVVRDSGGRS